MNHNQICNPKTEVPTSIIMNDCDYITAQLACEKDMSINMCYALNEASNETLYQKIYPIFEEEKQMQRYLYELMFRKGWYILEKAETQKITQKVNQTEQKLQELI